MLKTAHSHAYWALFCIKVALVTDPCMGSGHILVYMFDVLMQIYLSYGYTTNEAVESIVRHNLWGLDIDKRAAQLAYFAVMMKAQQYDSYWLEKQLLRPVAPNVFESQDSGKWEDFEPQMRRAFANHQSLLETPCVETAQALFECFTDAKEYGSIIQPNIDLDALKLLENTLDDLVRTSDLLDVAAQADAVMLSNVLIPMVFRCRALVQKYHVVVTNPPYMGAGGMNQTLIEYLQLYYPKFRTDIFSVVIDQMLNMIQPKGYLAYIAPQSLLFLSTQISLRKALLQSASLISLVDLGIKAFDSGFGTAMSVFGKGFPRAYAAQCIDLTNLDDKEYYYLHEKYNAYISRSDTFLMLPGNIFSYACTTSFRKWFAEKSIGNTEILDCGIKTGNNSLFVKLWFEVSIKTIAYNNSTILDIDQGKYRWFKYSQGGGFHRWYGAIENIVDLENDASRIKQLVSKSTYRLRDRNKYFLEGMVWPMVGTDNFSCRYLPYDVIPDIASNVLYCKGDYKWELLAYLNSIVFNRFMVLINPTVNYPIESVAAVPYNLRAQQHSQIKTICKNNVDACKLDWDSFETSWDFQRHPIVCCADKVRGTLESSIEVLGPLAYGTKVSVLVALAYELWKAECEDRFQKLKANEEELNRIFIDIYGLQDELTPEVEDKDVTVRKADLGRDIRSLISYAVGCMFGRYSVDVPGLVFAGGNFDDTYLTAAEPWTTGAGDVMTTGAGEPICFNVPHGMIIRDSQEIHLSYRPDEDGILPITDDEYFDDDIVSRFVEWVRTVFGAETLEANLKFIADALPGKGNPREVIRQYFLNDFFKDHLKVYQKRPIYWLFDSGKKNGFKCLIYMHRYQPDTLARIRTDYVHELQGRYRNAIDTLERQIAGASTSERVKLQKRLATLKAQAEELRVYEEKIHHLADQMIKIDLDDGVKHNYTIFKDVLAPIK